MVVLVWERWRWTSTCLMHCPNIMPKYSLPAVRFNNHSCMRITACAVTHTLVFLSRINNQVHSTTSNQVGGSSLVLRPSHCPVFDCLQYAKTGRRPGSIYHVSDVNIYSGRQSGRGALKWKSTLEVLLAVSICALEFRTFVEKNVCVKHVLLFKGSFPPLST